MKSLEELEDATEGVMVDIDEHMEDSMDVDSSDDEVPDKDEEELELEKAVFGDLEGFEMGIKNIALEEAEEEDSDDSHDSDDENDFNKMEDNQLFFVDGGDGQKYHSDDDSDDDSDSSMDSDTLDETLEEHGGRAAWADSDDENVHISLVGDHDGMLKKLRKTQTQDYVNGKVFSRRLREQYRKIYRVPDWAANAFKAKAKKDYDEDDSEGSDEEEQDVLTGTSLSEVLQRVTQYSNKESKLLRHGEIEVARLQDVNFAAPSRAAVEGLAFHPTHSLLLTGGFDKTLRLYQVDGKNNPVVTTLFMRHTPFAHVAFHPDGQRVYAGGRKQKHLYIWNAESGKVERMAHLYGHGDKVRCFAQFKLSPDGKYLCVVGVDGWLAILSATSGQWIDGCKIEGDVADFVWDGGSIIAVNTAGQVWEYNVESRSFTATWTDEGGVGITVLAIGGKANQWLAIGSESGYVNVYNRPKLALEIAKGQSPFVPQKPTAVLSNLTTPVSSLVFSPDGQMLAMASDQKRDSLKLVHVPSFTVFKNWPTQHTSVGVVTSVAFSPSCEYLTVGASNGRVRMFQLAHYKL
ncbi:WD40-repeat-containing domain protein [Yarrowia lipolytica]|nr:WD40-repeat-containing domain protein [Yarrowia lipolytica]